MKTFTKALTIITLCFLPFTFADIDGVDTEIFITDITDYVDMDKNFIHLWSARNHNWNKNEIYIPERESTKIDVYDIVMHHWIDLMSYEGKLQADTVVTFSIPMHTKYIVSDSYTFNYHFNKGEDAKKFYLQDEEQEIYLPWTADYEEVNKVVYFDGKVNIEKFVEFEMTLSDLMTMLTNAREKLQGVKVND